MAVVVGQGRVVSNFALTHFSAAKHFSGKTEEIESAHRGQPFGNFWEEISIYCSASIISAAASLEALINELFITPGPLQDRISDFETNFWGGEVTMRKWCIFKATQRIRGLEREHALTKYKKATNLVGGEPLSKIDPQFRAAELLFGFRNYLIHFKPLWDEDRRQDDLEQRLQGQFTLSPYVDRGASFLEKQCMSAGCSSWAVQTASNFVAYFGRKSQLDPRKLAAFHRYQTRRSASNDA